MGTGRLTRAQSARIRQLIIDSLPDQLRLPFYLWTRAAVVTLIEREYGLTVSLTTVGPGEQLAIQFEDRFVLSE